MIDLTDLGDYLSGGALDPDYEYRSKKRDLNEDWRIKKSENSRYSNCVERIQKL